MTPSCRGGSPHPETVLQPKPPDPVPLLCSLQPRSHVPRNPTSYPPSSSCPWKSSPFSHYVRVASPLLHWGPRHMGPDAITNQACLIFSTRFYAPSVLPTWLLRFPAHNWLLSLYTPNRMWPGHSSAVAPTHRGMKASKDPRECLEAQWLMCLLTD